MAITDIDLEVGEAAPPPFENKVINSIYNDKSLFLSAIKQNPSKQQYSNVTGVTVPHHLLAKDLIAEIFSSISENEYQKIIVISPDHFNSGETQFSTTSKNIQTVFGEINTDQELVQAIVTNNELIQESKLFRREHGIHSVAPFIEYYFPEAKVTVVAIKINSSKEQLDTLYYTLKPHISSQTLIVQSTDFSHYLTEDVANQKDRQTVIILESRDPQKLFTLNQPDNIDSIGAQYLQMLIQNQIFQSQLQIIHQVNSNQYTSEPVDETTSYITQIYSN